ncbi:hypothetical protein [Bacillus coahuilensis]|uniref:hypothetical protein n=1 Tax=Bacillus coahuilensis TaxID=408580 RepID=UPI000185122F|nr:hypothetical protein [Bacillus coahuilensis]
MTQVKEVNKQEEMVNEYLKALQEEKDLATFKQAAVLTIDGFIKRNDLDENQLEKLNGSIAAIYMSKDRKQAEFYLDHANEFMNAISEAKIKGWI